MTPTSCKNISLALNLHGGGGLLTYTTYCLSAAQVLNLTYLEFIIVAVAVIS